jgi:excisionase family DNA binding protein
MAQTARGDPSSPIANVGVVAGTIPAANREGHMDQLLYTIPQCCRLAAVGRTKFYELIASGEIPVRKIGKKSLVAAADLKRWAEQLPAIAVKLKPADGADMPSACLAEKAPAVITMTVVAAGTVAFEIGDLGYRISPSASQLSSPPSARCASKPHRDSPNRPPQPSR